jgi:hypothetical protein
MGLRGRKEWGWSTVSSESVGVKKKKIQSKIRRKKHIHSGEGAGAIERSVTIITLQV